MAEEGALWRVHTEFAERDQEESEIHSDEETKRHLEGQGLRHILGQEETGRSETTEVATHATLAPTQAEEIQMECEGVVQEKETDENRNRTPTIQHQNQNEGIQSELEEKGIGEESVEAEVWFAVDNPAHTNVEGSTAAQPTRPKRPKNEDGEKRFASM